MRPRPISLVEDLQRQLATAQAVIRRMQEAVSQDKATEAVALYREGASNWWVARLLGIPVSEARALTREGA